VTTRGFGIDEVRQVARWISEILHEPEATEAHAAIAVQVQEMTRQFPLPGVSRAQD
jgi:glycine/serine hydroxymethyltransferase